MPIKEQYIIDCKDKSLIGSSLFFQSNSLIGRIVRLAGLIDFKNGFKKDDWSHVGTIIEQDNGKLGILEALKPKVVINDLEDRLKTCEDKIVLAKLNDKNIDKINKNYETFKKEINKHNGVGYNTLNAVLSGIDLIPDNTFLSKFFTKRRNVVHCSFIDGRLKQSVGILAEFVDSKELTPQDCFNMQIYKDKILIQ